MFPLVTHPSSSGVGRCGTHSELPLCSFCMLSSQAERQQITLADICKAISASPGTTRCFYRPRHPHFLIAWNSPTLNPAVLLQDC